MSSKTPKSQPTRKANQAVSRPEDPDTQRQTRAARALRVDELPQGGAMITRDEELTTDSETETALKRATRRKS
ncbi:MAG TPA: hypothetical protein VMW05_02765 [Methyloceanibacter sp.]|nr:hypothetical protein [Methyloceanibacter sp.]